MSAVIKTLPSQHKMSIDEAFPQVDPLIGPLGNQVLVQLRCAKRKTSGGILITDSDQTFDTEQIRVGKVIALGAIAYRDRETFEPWREGAWISKGDFVRVPGYAGGDRWCVTIVDEAATAEAQHHLDQRRRELADTITRIEEPRNLGAGISRRDLEILEPAKSELKRLPKVADELTKKVFFCMYNDFDIKGLVTGDPLDIVDYI